MSQPPSQPPRTNGPQNVSPWRGVGIWPLLLMGMAGVIIYTNSTGGGAQPSNLEYSRFLELVEQGRVAEVTIFDRRLVGVMKDAPRKPGQPVPKFAVNRPSGELEQGLFEALRKANVKFEAQQTSQLVGALYLFGFFLAMSLVLMYLMRRANPAERAMAFGRSKAQPYIERDTKVTFEDVAGIDEPKQELQEIVEYLRTPEKFRRLGGRIPKGVLLVGAPGTGKTLLAKAVAGEAKVPFFSMSGSDFVELFVGVGASRVRDLFQQAQQHSPCIVFIDELDALGKARGQSLMGGGHDEREQTLNQLLVEMDGFDSSSNVIVMAATNRPEILDPALMRPGRFDRQVLIPPPDVRGREAILQVHVAHIKLDPEVDLHRVAGRTPGFVGADLANVVNEAALLAARRERESVTFEDFDEAIDRVSVGLERRSQVMTDEEKRVTAYHEAGHAVVATFCPDADPVHKVSIIPRGFAGGYTQLLPADDRRLVTRAHLDAQLTMLLGGRSAEELVLGEISTGAAADIRQVTAVARAMVVELGMSETLGPVNYDAGAHAADPFGLAFNLGHRVSEATAQQVDAEVRRLVDEAHQRAQAILTDHREELDRLVERLLETEVVDREELERLFGLGGEGGEG